MPASKKNLFEKNKEMIIKDFELNISYLDMEKKYGIGRNTIRKYILSMGYKRSEETKQQILKDKREKALLKKYGVINISQIKDEEMQKRRIAGVKRRRRGTWSGKSNPNYKNKIGNNFGFKSGIREDIGNYFFRSSWEANFARILNYNQTEWEYEPTTFEINDKETYTPDFRINSNTYVEIKGYWHGDAKRKFEEFKNKFSDIEIILICEDKYKELIKKYFFLDLE